jgi:integrase
MSFEDWLLTKGRTASTIKKHLIRLEVLGRELHEWTVEYVEGFILEKIKEGSRHTTLNAYIDTIRLYSQYKNYSYELRNYKHYKSEYAIKGTFSDDEILQIITLPCPTGMDKDSWDKYSLLFSLLAFTGCRPQEICTIKRNQIDWGRNVFSIEHTKTGVPRFVPIPPNLVDTIKIYLNTIDSEYLFITRKGEVLSDKSYYHNFKKRMEILGIDRPHITPYSFRHSYATSLLEADVNIHKIAKLMGHSITQTSHYEHLTTKDLQKAIIRHPLIRSNAQPDDIIKDIKEYVEGYELDKHVNVKYTLLYTNRELTIKIRPN